MNETEVDIMDLTETNVCWSRVDTRDIIWERARMWFEGVNLLVAYNTKYKYI